MRKEMGTRANIECTWDTREILSENASSVEIEEEVTSMQAISSKREVHGKVVLGYISPSWFEVQTKKLMRNLKGASVLYFYHLINMILGSYLRE